MSAIEQLARDAGFSNKDDFLKAVEKSRIEKEAKAKGIDAETYSRLNALEQKLALAEKEKEEVIKRTKVNKFVETFENFQSEKKITEEEKMKILDEMDKDGWTVEDLAFAKNPKAIIRGYASEIIAQREVQKVLEKEKLNKKFKEDPYKNAGNNQNQSVDEELDKELKAYAKERGLSYLK